MNKDRSKKTILLVEDEAVISIFTARVISKKGYEVITASSGEQAVEIARENRSIDLILMDIDLGRGIDGTETARQILSFCKIPIIFHTSHSERDMVDKVKGITRYGYVIKSSGDFVLQSSIEMAFELFEAHTNLEITIESLKQSEERFRLLFNHLPHGLAHFDYNGIIRKCNQALADMTGLSKEALTGFNMMKLTDTKLTAAIQSALCGDVCVYEDMFHSAVQEKSMPVRLTIAPLKDTAEGILGGFIIAENRE